MKAKSNMLVSVMKKLSQVFIEPPQTITAERERQNRRLLSSLLLFLAIMFVFAFLNNIPGGVAAPAFSWAAYLLSRTRYHALSAPLALLALSMPSIIGVLSAPGEELRLAGGAIQRLGWLIIVLALASLSTRAWVTGTITTLFIGFTLSLLIIRPEVNRMDVAWLSALFGVAGGLLAIASVIRYNYLQQIEAQKNQLEAQQKAIEDSAQRYRELVETIKDVVYRADDEGYITYVSPSVSILTGHAEEKFIGKHFADFVEHSSRQALLDQHTKQLKQGEAEKTITFPTVRSDGEIRWVEQKTDLIADASGKPEGFQSIMRDVTERYRSEEMLRALYDAMVQPGLTPEEHFNLVLEVGVLFLGLDLGIISYIEDDTYTVLHATSPDGSLQAGQQFDFKHTYCDITYRADSIISIGAMATSEHNHHPCYTAFGLEAYIGVPLIVAGERFGTLNFSSHEPRKSAFTAGEENFLSLMGSWVSALLERQRLEERLRLNNKAVESGLSGIVVADARAENMPLIYVNPAFERMTGYRAEETTGKNCRFLQGDDHDQPALNVLRNAIKQGKDCVVILRNYRKDGTLFWNELSVNPILNDKGVVTHFVGIQNDITERIEAEVKLKQRDTILQSIAMSSAVLLQQGDWKDAIPTVLAQIGGAAGTNRTFIFEKQHDTPEDGLIVRMPYEWTADGVPSDIDNPLYQALPLSEIAPRWAALVRQRQIISGYAEDFSAEERMLLNDDVVFILIIPIFVGDTLWGAIGFDDCYGTREWLKVDIDLLRGVADNIGVAIERQYTERQIQAQNETLVKANREIAVARKQAEAANKLKSQFMATMSHELRTPLNAVIGYAQLQLAGMVGDMTSEQLGFQERILANAQHLLQLINEVLDLSKIEAGRLELAHKPFGLQQLMDEIVLQNQILAQDKGLAFEMSVDERLPATLIGDAGRIKQIIINLVSNAVKFTDEGSVKMDTVLHDGDNWRVTVTDTGIGISPTMQETIFDEFRQAEQGIDRGGTGLGLAIVRKLVLMMGGNIRVTSEVGKGSTFTVTLPIITKLEETDEPFEALER